MAELKFKHFFTVKNGAFIFDDQEMLEYKRKNLEGKRGYALLEEELESNTPDQYGYYFGGIIRKECMNSNDFAGLTEKEIHMALLSTLRSKQISYINKKGERIFKTIEEDFRSFGKKKMTLYIEEVIAYLQTDHNIYVKPAEHYKYNKFYDDTKTFKSTDL
jgi:hypothetical protein